MARAKNVPSRTTTQCESGKPLSRLVHGFALHYDLAPAYVAEAALTLLNRPTPTSLRAEAEKRY